MGYAARGSAGCKGKVGPGFFGGTRTCISNRQQLQGARRRTRTTRQNVSRKGDSPGGWGTPSCGRSSTADGKPWAVGAPVGCRTRRLGGAKGCERVRRQHDGLAGMGRPTPASSANLWHKPGWLNGRAIVIGYLSSREEMGTMGVGTRRRQEEAGWKLRGAA